MSEPKLSLDDCPSVRVWDALLDLLQQDETLRRIGVELPNLDGRPGYTRPRTIAQAPSVRLSFSGGDAEWVYADAQVEPLVIDADILCRGLHDRDVRNLWHALVRAIYPAGDHARSVANVRALQQAGAHSGIVHYTAPTPLEISGQAGHLRATARLRIDVLVQT